MHTKPLLILSILLAVLTSCNNQSAETPGEKKDSNNISNVPAAVIKEEAVSYSAGSTNMKGYVAYDDSKPGDRPIVLVIHEWWGLTEYPRIRARQLAELGYFAMAVDMYGDGKIADNPKDAENAATPFYSNAQLAKERLDAALAKAKTFSQADSSKVVAIGYCFGGSMALNYANLGAPVTGVVSFHGALQVAAPQKGSKTQYLICHGGADNFVPQPQVDAFRKAMDSAGVAYTFKTYEGAKHAFTNPKATEIGQKNKIDVAYNAAADSASWNDMKAFFERILH